jgi:hypothetical protein
MPRIHTVAVIAAATILAASARADLILISQTRSVYASASHIIGEDPPYCAEWDSAAADGFGFFEAYVHPCESAYAAQTSMLLPGEISALGSAHGFDYSGAGHFDSGHGESIFEVVFTSLHVQGIRLTGQIHAEGTPYQCATASVTLFIDEGNVLFEESLAFLEGGTIEFNQDVLVLPSAEYTLRASACSLSCSNSPTPGMGCGGTATYEFALGPGCPADIIGNDAMVDVADLLILLYYWGEPDDPDYDCDIDDDGIVDVNDLLLLLARWGSCP